MTRDVMIAATMIVADVPDSTIRFFLKVYDYMVGQKEGFNCSDLSKQSDYTSESARQHVTVLTEYEFLNRTGYRSWTLNSSKFIEIGDAIRNG
mgnify:CR=1 FL=1